MQCLAALHSPSTGIVDSHALMLSLQGDLENAGGMVAFNAPVARGECGSAGMVLHTADGTALLADAVINAAGLMAPAVARRMDGVDAESGLVHTATTSAANAHDITQAHALLHGQEEVVFADAGYRGAAKREEVQAQHPDVSWQIAMMPGQRKALDKSQPAGVLKEKLEKLKASVRAKVEHPFRGDQVPVRSPQDLLPGLGQEHQPVVGAVCAVEPVDGAQATTSRAAGMSAPAARAKAGKLAQCGLKREKSAVDSALVSSCEYSRLNSRFGGGYAELP